MNEAADAVALRQARECREFHRDQELREARGKLADVLRVVADDTRWQPGEIDFTRRALRQVVER